MNRPRLAVLLTLGVILLGTAGHLVAGADAPPPAKADAPAQPPEKVALALDTGGHTNEVVYLAFVPPDDRELVSVSRDGTVRFWDLESGETVQVLRPPHPGGVAALNVGATLSADGRFVAVSHVWQQEWYVYVISRQDERVVRTFKVTDGTTLWGLALSPDGKWLAAAGYHPRVPATPDREPFGSLRLWNLERQEEPVLLPQAEPVHYAVAFSPDSTRLAAGTFAGDSGIWSRVTGARVDRIGRGAWNAQLVRGIDWSPDGKWVATAGSEGVRLWDVARKTSILVSELASHRVRFSGDGKKLLYLPTTVEAERTARVCDVAHPKAERVLFDQHDRAVTAGALSHDGSLAATAGGTGYEISVWKTAAPEKQPRKLVGRGGIHHGVGVTADGKALAWGDQDPGPEARFAAQVPLGGFFSLEKLTLGPLAPARLPEWAPKPNEYLRAQLSRDGLSLVVHPDRRGIDVMRDGKTVRTRRSREMLCATLLPGPRVVVGTEIGLVLFDVETNRDVCRLQVQSGSAVVAVAASPDGRYLVSSGGDLILRLWDLAKVKPPDKPGDPLEVVRPRVSLFVAERDWIAWTPDGYFASSADGDRLMGWRVDNGPDRLASFHPAEQFRNVLYRPDRIQAVVNPQIIFRERRVHATDVLPPSVAITEAPPSILDTPDCTLRATAESADKNPVTEMRLLVDGRPLADADPQLTKDPKGTRVEAKWTVRPPAGRHRLSVLALTKKESQGYSGQVWVTNVAPAPPPRLFFLAVGIDVYQNIPKLTCAVNDARALEAAIKDKVRPPLYGGVATRLLVNEQATRRGILDGLDWLGEKAEANDVVLIFYAGHGERGDKGEFHLLTAAYDPDRFAETAVSGKELKAKLTALRSRRVLVLLDACHSGTIALGANDALAGELKQRDCGAAVLCAAAGDEFSLESERDGHGFFTKELLDGLGGAARNDDGEVTLARLYVHVEEKVPKDTGDQQHPVLVGLTAIRSFPLARLEKAEKR